MDMASLQHFFGPNLSSQMETLSQLLLVITAILHVIFAGAVAKDSGKLSKVGQTTCLVSGVTWAFATLIGGVFTAAIYWLIHHSNLTRSV